VKTETFNKWEKHGAPINSPVVTGVPHMKWRQLKNETSPVPDPRKNSTLVGPTVPEGKQQFQKFKFSETYYHPPFCCHITCD